MISHRDHMRFMAGTARERGSSLIEVLGALFLAGLAAVGIVMNTTVGLRVAKLTEIHQIASTLASSKVESLAAIDTSTLTSANGSTESNLTYPGLAITFSRVTTVTVNADDSRTIDVQVTSNSDALPTTVNFQTRFAVWE